MSNKSNCSVCEKSFNISTLEKYNGKCKRCSTKTPVEVEEQDNPKKARSTSTPNSYQKSPIPARLRQEVWEKNIGDKFWGNCFVCNIRLHVMEWSCGHIQSEFKGGAMVFENMKVICKSCNSKMGTENLLEYKARKYPELDNALKETSKEVIKETPKEVVKDAHKETSKEEPKGSIFSRCFCL